MYSIHITLPSLILLLRFTAWHQLRHRTIYRAPYGTSYVVENTDIKVNISRIIGLSYHTHDDITEALPSQTFSTDQIRLVYSSFQL